MWHAWKKKLRVAIRTPGMLDIFNNNQYAARNPVDNETIHYLLQVASLDRKEAHLVDKFEADKDEKAFIQLKTRYESDKLRTEIAEEVRSKLEKLTLSTKITGSEYINSFQL